MKIITKTTAILFISMILFSCQKKKNIEMNNQNLEQKIGVLFVNHGSPSKTWREALLDLEKSVAPEILSDKKISGTATAFMEYNEPSIATRLKEFDKAGYTDVIIVPIFLTVSPHTFEDIPTIIGQKEDKKSFEMMKLEKIERYVPRAKTHITPLLDFTDVLQNNVLRRVKSLSKNPSEEGLVLIGYGDEDYDKEWTELFSKVAENIKKNTGISEYSYGWCGHIARYKSEPTTKAINKILEKKKTALVIPVLVAHDENFQIRIVGGGVKAVKNNQERVLYRPDAILPDDNIKDWVVSIVKEFTKKIEK